MKKEIGTFRGKEISKMNISELRFDYKGLFQSWGENVKKAYVVDKINDSFLNGTKPTHANYIKLHDEYENRFEDYKLKA